MVSRAELKKQIQKLGICVVKGNYIRKKDVKKVLAAPILEHNRKDLLSWIDKDFRGYLSKHVKDIHDIDITLVSNKDSIKALPGYNPGKHNLMLEIAYSNLRDVGFGGYDIAKYKASMGSLWANSFFVYYSGVPDVADIGFKSPEKTKEEKEKLEKIK